MRCARNAVIAAIVALPCEATAQRVLVLDAGAGSSSHQLGPSGTALSIAPRLLWLDRHARLDVGGLYTRGTALGWNAELQASGGVFFHPFSGFTLELGGADISTRHHLGRGTQEITAGPTALMETGSFRASLSFAVGRGSARYKAFDLTGGAEPPIDSAGSPPGGSAASVDSKAFTRASAAGVMLLAGIELRGGITRTRFGQRALRAGALWTANDPGGDTLFRRYILRYDDLMLGAGWANRWLRVDGALTQRLGLGEFRARAWHVEMAARLTPDLALFGSTGRTLSRITVDLPARGYATVGLRWTVGLRRSIAVSAAPKAGTASFRAEREGQVVRLAVRAEHARRVEVMGDFTDWEPVDLAPESAGWWVLALALGSGMYHLNVRYDGGKWEVPRGLPSQADEFEGRVGVLVLP